MSDEPTDVRRAITEGRTAVGVELGSTRIKAVLIGPDHAPRVVPYAAAGRMFANFWRFSGLGS